jgi:hypothetical protein
MIPSVQLSRRLLLICRLQSRACALLIRAALILSTVCLLSATDRQAAAQKYIQQGSPLVGSGYLGTTPNQGTSVALSADGNTALVGGDGDNSFIGAAWVFTRDNGNWSQQGSKLVGASYSGTFAYQGSSVALSADGNTALVGGMGDNSYIGAAWVFTRDSDGTWSQQGSKLVGAGYLGTPRQGWSVALSADGNTALVGGASDNSNIGAVWVFTRDSNGNWSQQGSKLVGASYSGTPFQGYSVALSADGNTALVGGDEDNSGIGAVWVFTRDNGNWTQQGPKLVGTVNGSAASALQGNSVALSADGNTALVGGPGYASFLGAAWVFVRNGTTWEQQTTPYLQGSPSSNYPPVEGASVALSASGNFAIIGGFEDNTNIGATWVATRSETYEGDPGAFWSMNPVKLVGTGYSGPTVYQGRSVAISADGNTLIAGGPQNNSGIGAVWIFQRVNPTNTHDFNGDGESDIAWRDTGGDVAVWLMNGTQTIQSKVVGPVPLAVSIVGQRDFNGDGKADLLWRDTSGNITMWFMNGVDFAGSASVGNVPTSWSIVGTGDFNGDGYGDILWKDNTGNVAIWLMQGSSILQSGFLVNVGTSWSVVGTTDFNGDGKTDILWMDNAGNMEIWLMNGLSVLQSGGVGNVGTSWSVVGTGDFNGDGNGDILWKDNAGNVAIWLMNGLSMSQAEVLVNVGTSWNVAVTGDFNGDGKSDILWRDTSGNVAMWLMNGFTRSEAVVLGNISTSWTIQGLNAE